MVQPTQPKPFTLMLVEKSPKSQEAFRRFFGALGVRMLITTNADRALGRLAEPSPPAKGIVFVPLSVPDVVSVLDELFGYQPPPPPGKPT
jgi:hypothetical protein